MAATVSAATAVETAAAAGGASVEATTAVGGATSRCVAAEAAITAVTAANFTMSYVAVAAVIAATAIVTVPPNRPSLGDPSIRNDPNSRRGTMGRHL